jgi:POT family proton-dependent oligopeptide transporter
LILSMGRGKASTIYKYALAVGILGPVRMALNDIIAKFPRLFWVVSTLEMVERAAYYGMLAALPYHLVYNLHFETTSVGLILSLLTPFLYILPIVSGALAGKYGFRPVMVPAFLLITVGYVMAGFVSSFYLMLAAFIILGIGTGTFKPMTSGTIATTTSEGTRNLGYSIYYWMINVGSFLAPLLVAIVIPKESYQLVFFMSAGLVAANFFIAFLFFKNPIEPDPKKSVIQVLKGAVQILRDKRFMVLMLIYSGFWFMYAVNNAAVVLYMVDFKVVPDWFPPALVQTVNPITILIAGPLLGKLVEKYDSLHAMIGGMMLFIIGILVMGLTTVSVLLIAGIVIFSIAEFIVHPTYLSYISKIAPRDKVAVYMGYGFIPAFIGYSFGNFLVALAYTIFSEESHRPKFFWSLIGAVGLLTIACLMLYSQYLGRHGVIEKSSASKLDIEAPIEATDEEDRAFPDVVSAQGSMPLRKHPVLESQITVAVALLVIPGLLFGAYAGGTDMYYRPTVGTSGNSWDGYVIANTTSTISGESRQNSETPVQIGLNESNIMCATFTLSWTDEADQGSGLRALTNQPDEFGLSVTTSNGTTIESQMVANIQGQKGIVTLDVEMAPKKPQSSGNETFNVIVVCGDCGDQTSRFGFRDVADDGNFWTLQVGSQYYMKKTG